MFVEYLISVPILDHGSSSRFKNLSNYGDSRLVDSARGQAGSRAYALTIGHYAQADAAFVKASSILRQMPDSPATTLYASDWEADRSELLAKRGQVAVLLHHLWISCGQYKPLHNTRKRKLVVA